MYQLTPCSSAEYRLLPDNWLEKKVDSKILTALRGGVDNRGVYWEGQRAEESMTQSLGLSGIFTILCGFVPVVGPAIETAGTIASGVGTFLATAAATNDPQEAQKLFSQKVLVYYRSLLSGMDDLIASLFAGEQIPKPGPESFNITDMMKNGTWVNPTNTLTRVSDLNRKVRTEILARSTDSLWKTPTNRTGPSDSKYCADGGVYYTYNFVEHNDEDGEVGWPWGAAQLYPKTNISLDVSILSTSYNHVYISAYQWTTEASAKSYRLMKKIGGDLFNSTQLNGTAAFLLHAFSPGEVAISDGAIDISDLVGRYPGSWTIPVCDGSTWG
ncbi:MAG: hypothetical protein Q9213_004587 [Squamulea squamosa]